METEAKELTTVIEVNISKLPEKIAVVAEGNNYSYKSLNEEANRIISCLSPVLYEQFKSGRLKKKGPICIGVCLPYNFQLFAAIWAICKSECTYVPLDPALPDERLMFMINDCQMAIILTDSANKNRFSDLCVLDVTLLDEEKCLAVDSVPKTDFFSNETAYIIYTSGTTGNPKGVPISYKNLFHLLQQIIVPEVFNLSSQSKILGFASIAFDASVVELYGTLFTGATLVMTGTAERQDVKKLYQLILNNQITYIQLTPSLATLLPSWSFPTLDTFVLGGEKILQSIVNHALQYSYRLMNVYGPTENTVVSTVRVIQNDINIQNIGKTLPGIEGYVLSPDFALVEPGEVGELCLGGLQLTSGYLNRPQLNKQAFVKNTYNKKSQFPILYCTGDLVRLMYDGSYEFVGRKDSQIKLNGHRIELGEIASQIEKIENIEQAYVTVESSKLGDRLIAYVKIKENKAHDNILQDIKYRLKDFLPYYMIPSVWVPVSEFSRTLNGKIDTKQLMNLTSQLSQKVDSKVTLLEKEKIMIGVVSHLLGIETISVNDDLVDDLGMTSMQIMQLPMEVEIFGLYISVDDIYRYRTIRKIVQNHSMRMSYWFNEPLPGKPVLVIVSGYTSFAFLYSSFAKTLSEKYSIYVFESYHDYPEELRSSASELVNYYLEVLLPIARQYGVDVITGFCLGGELGLLLAHELYNKTSILPHVVVLDGEVGRSKSMDEVVPLYYDFFPDEVNEKRNKLDMNLIETTPDFRYKGKVTSVLSRHFMSELSPFSQRLVVTEMHKKCAKIFFDRAAEYWKMYYPDCHIMYVDADHWSFLRFPESLEPICAYFSNLGK